MIKLLLIFCLIFCSSELKALVVQEADPTKIVIIEKENKGIVIIQPRQLDYDYGNKILKRKPLINKIFPFKITVEFI